MEEDKRREKITEGNGKRTYETKIYFGQYRQITPTL